jgi:hypothetical protein
MSLFDEVTSRSKKAHEGQVKRSAGAIAQHISLMKEQILKAADSGLRRISYDITGKDSGYISAAIEKHLQEEGFPMVIRQYACDDWSSMPSFKDFTRGFKELLFNRELSKDHNGTTYTVTVSW